MCFNNFDFVICGLLRSMQHHVPMEFLITNLSNICTIGGCFQILKHLHKQYKQENSQLVSPASNDEGISLNIHGLPVYVLSMMRESMEIYLSIPVHWSYRQILPLQRNKFYYKKRGKINIFQGDIAQSFRKSVYAQLRVVGYGQGGATAMVVNIDMGSCLYEKPGYTNYQGRIYYLREFPRLE